ncbi:hypothetical protein F5884DRAFT_667293 [Xylogone sp. PMI_703]|nr:hypothetical protein F5884DRAFT_667293 [Xylogone sp. PMI_703]
MVDINVTDEKLLGKFGTDLTANFADIRAHDSDAFCLRKNLSNNVIYSLCACATGYIWIYVTKKADTSTPGYSIMQVQIGTFALRARAITTAEIPFIYKPSGRDPEDGQLALLCSAVLAKYLRLRMMGQQYEYAAELAVKQSRKELSSFRVVDPGRYENFFILLLDVCRSAPMPPTSDVSLISRSMITKRWQRWRESSILKRRVSYPERILACLKKTPLDSFEILSGPISKLSVAPKRGQTRTRSWSMPTVNLSSLNTQRRAQDSRCGYHTAF